MSDYKVGDIIKCIVSGITKYGIFVRADFSYSGLIHISEISNEFVDDINKFVKMGDTIYAQILDIDEATMHLCLSIKNINYKDDSTYQAIKETRLGFLPLKEKLPEWINDKLTEYKTKDN